MEQTNSTVLEEGVPTQLPLWHHFPKLISIIPLLLYYADDAHLHAFDLCIDEHPRLGCKTLIDNREDSGSPCQLSQYLGSISLTILTCIFIGIWHEVSMVQTNSV